MERILSDEGVHLRLVGTQLVFSSVLLVHKFVLVVLVHIHSPKAGGHGALGHIGGGLVALSLSEENPSTSSNLAFFRCYRCHRRQLPDFRLLLLSDFWCGARTIFPSSGH